MKNENKIEKLEEKYKDYIEKGHWVRLILDKKLPIAFMEKHFEKIKHYSSALYMQDLTDDLVDKFMIVKKTDIDIGYTEFRLERRIFKKHRKIFDKYGSYDGDIFCYRIQENELEKTEKEYKGLIEKEDWYALSRIRGLPEVFLEKYWNNLKDYMGMKEYETLSYRFLRKHIKDLSRDYCFEVLDH